MSEDSDSINIPEISIAHLIKNLSGLYAGAIGSDVPLKELPTPFLWGPAGVGKSQGVAQFAQRIRDLTGKKVNVSVVHLLLFSPVDLRGVPVADEHRKFTDWLKPRIFDMDPGGDVINILFLDELSAAPQSVQTAAYQITLDRRVGEHTLPDNCIVIAAGNRTTDQSVAYKMPKALANRLMHFVIKSDLASWKGWAMNSGIDPRIIGFLGFDSSRLAVEPGSSDLAYPTPRTWSFVDSILKTAGQNGFDSCRTLIAACIGKDTELAFEQWCSVYNKLPSAEEIMGGRCRVYPKKPDKLYALCSGLASTLIGKGEGLLTGELENACAYASRFPMDFAMSFFSDLHEHEATGKMLMKCRAFNQWLVTTKSAV